VRVYFYFRVYFYLHTGNVTDVVFYLPLTAAVCSAGHVSASYKANVMDGLDATACLQVDKDMKYKYGIQGTYKA